MNLQDLTLQQLKEILRDAPKGAKWWNSHRKIYVRYKEGVQAWVPLVGWEPTGFAGEPIDSVIKLSDIRAELKARNEQYDWVGAKVIYVDSNLSNDIWQIQREMPSDSDFEIAISTHGFPAPSKCWRFYVKTNNIRLATNKEITAGHRIDEPLISNEMASPCTASDSAKNQAQMDLQSNEPDIITDKLDPKKCRIVDPALPYDEPNDFDAMSVSHRSPACKCHEFPFDAELKVPAGLKHDQSKPRYSLIPAGALALVVDVLEYGATKYAPNNWRHVDNARERYYNASMRHIQAWWSGEQNDPETGLPHLAHAVCSLMFLMALKGEQGE